VPANWRPIDLREQGPALYETLRREKIRECLATLPGWNHKFDKAKDNALFADARGAAEIATFHAFLNFQKAALDHQGAPKIAAVRYSLTRLSEAIGAARSALGEMDPRSTELLKRQAGGIPNVLVSPPEDNWRRGRDRLQLLDASLSEAQGWAREIIEGLPAQDSRGDEHPGLNAFVIEMANIWENYAPGRKVTASRSKGMWPDFMRKLLAAGGYRCSLTTVADAARRVVVQRNRDHPDRIVVEVKDRNLKLAELAELRRKSVRKKRKRITTKGQVRKG
jgi:hypothetical protein